MRACEKCGGKGYLESFYHYGAKARPMIRQCCDIRAYSRRVQEMAAPPLPPRLPRTYEDNVVEARFGGRVIPAATDDSSDPRPKKKGKPCPVLSLKSTV